MTTFDLSPAPSQSLSLAEATLALARDIGALASRLSALEATPRNRK